MTQEEETQVRAAVSACIDPSRGTMVGMAFEAVHDLAAQNLKLKQALVPFLDKIPPSDEWLEHLTRAEDALALDGTDVSALAGYSELIGDPGGASGGRAGSGMALEHLNRSVTDAILRAEALPPGSWEAQQAFLDVANIEEEIAMILGANSVDGEIARLGAVAAALSAKEPLRAVHLGERYLADALSESAGAKLRELLDEANADLAGAPGVQDIRSVRKLPAHLGPCAICGEVAEHIIHTSPWVPSGRKVHTFIECSKAWYYVDGVRYCTFCRTRRCKRQAGGSLECVRDERRES